MAVTAADNPGHRTGTDAAAAARRDCMMATELGAWLRRQRENRGWTRRDMARQLIGLGRDSGDASMPSIEGMCHNIHRWERGQGGLTERYKLGYCRVLGILPGPFGSGPGQLAMRPDPSA